MLLYKKLILLISGFIFSMHLLAFNACDKTQISLITASPGPELYSVFGHNALRIKDSTQNIDYFFNYGTFDFDTPNFYIKFARGKLLYFLSVEDYQSFLYVYQINGQYLKEQILNLNTQQKQFIYDFIENNYKPANRGYKYDFYADNCATRIRDIIYKAYNNKITFPQSLTKRKFQTMRQELNHYLEYFPWTHMGIDIVMGLTADEITNINTEMFLPEYFFKDFAQASVDGHCIIDKTNLILPQSRTNEYVPFYFKPTFILWLMFIVLFILSLYFKSYLFIIEKIWFTALGLLGFLIVFMWFFADHHCTKMNLNLLWLLPTDLIIWLPKSKIKKYYFKTIAIITILIFISWILQIYPQGVNQAFLPLWSTLILLSWNINLSN